MVESGPRVWASITGYGRDAPMADWVAFGDDAAVAGGLVARDGDDGDAGSGRPCFMADAVADPLSGMVAAAAVQDALSSGGRWLLDVALAEVASFVSRAGAGQPWRPATEDLAASVSRPVAPVPSERGPELGEHTASVLAELVR
jgi:crotonobetainyl-CoA:carnitine CoA-transferase CaiB-like acyl-CoA transferase